MNLASADYCAEDVRILAVIVAELKFRDATYVKSGIITVKPKRSLAAPAPAARARA
jgi:hypothetical protein